MLIKNKNLMKKFTLLVLMIFTTTVMAQTTFNWVAESISPGNNLQQMHLYTDNTAVITGNGGAFSKYNPTSDTWSPVKITTPVYDFTSLSIKNGSGLLSSRRGKMVDNPSGGNEDLYANGLLLKTTDNGATWTNFDLSPLANISSETLNPMSAGSIATDNFAVEYIDENNILLYCGWYDYRTGTKTSRGAVFATTNGGTSWTPITGDLESAVITTIKSASTYSVFGGLNQFYKNITGQTESINLYPALVIGAANDQTIYVNDVTFVDDNTFYVSTVSNGVLKTTDGGASFTQTTGVGATTGAADFYVHNSNVMVILGTSSQSKLTINGGTNWTACNPGATIYEIGGVFNGFLYGLANGKVYKLSVENLEAGVSSWILVEMSTGNNLQQMHIVDNTTAFITGYGQTMKRSTDGGLTWNDVDCPDPILPLAEELDFNALGVSGNLSIAAARRFKLIDYPTTSTYTDLTVDGILFTSTDNWATWNVLDIRKIGELTSTDASLNPTLAACYGADPYSLAITNSTTYYVWINWYETTSETTKSTHSRIFKTTNSGGTWVSISDNFGTNFITDINFMNENYGIITGNNVLLKTTNGGTDFTNLLPTILIGTDGSMFINGVTIIDENEFYVYTSTDGVFKTTNGGADFTKFPTLSGTNDFAKLNNSTYIALGTSTKSYYSNTGGASWENCYPGSSIWEIGEVMNGKLYALANGNVYKIPIAEIASGVGINEFDKPSDISIRYYAESIELVSAQADIDQCILYNVTGKIIATYTPKSTLCRIETGSLPNGIYIAATLSNGKRATNKLYIK
jgi:photosystem II stability/assembly factor-like uncharacterized protein